MHVVGRNNDTLWLPAQNGRNIPILPLALNTVIEENAGELIFQVIQSGPQSLSIRTHGNNIEARQKAFKKISESLAQYFLTQKLMPVKLEFDPLSPQRDATSGKMKQVCGQH